MQFWPIQQWSHLGANVCGIGTRHELPQKAVQLGALDVAIAWVNKGISVRLFIIGEIT